MKGINYKIFKYPNPLITGLVILGMVPLDVMLPSFGEISQYFKVNILDVSLSITFFTVGFSFSQLIMGPLSDSYGRKPILIFGLLFAIIGSIGCIFSNQYEYFLFWRIIQAIGASSFVVAQAIVQDIFIGDEAIRARIYLTTLSGVLISFSPLIGVFLQSMYGWVGSFYFFCIISLLLVAYCVGVLKESATKKKNSVLLSFKSYFFILKNLDFNIYSIIGGFSFSCHFAFIISSPFIFIETLKFDIEKYGFIMLFYGLAYVLGGLFAAKLSKKIDQNNQIILGLVIIITAGILLLSLNIFYGLSLITILFPMLIGTAGTCLVRPASLTKSMDLFDLYAGTASAASNTIRLLIGGIITSLVSILGEAILVNLAILLILSSLVSLLFLFNTNDYRNRL